MPQDKPLEIKALIADKQFLSGNSRLSESIEDYPEGIIIPIDKPYRWTSADVIRKVKWAACRHFHKKNLKVGHAGTLDPLATGVLLVCIGKATKLAETLQKEGKEYLAGVSFGATTPSYDLEKAIDQEYPVEGVTEESVREVLPRFLGEQEQIAPLFSAKSVDGVRAYELARKQYREAHKEKTDVMTDFDHTVAETLNKQIINISGMELISFFPNGKESGPELSDEELRPNPRIKRCGHIRPAPSVGDDPDQMQQGNLHQGTGQRPRRGARFRSAPQLIGADKIRRVHSRELPISQ